ncbi:thermonuclease family protein [Pseudomonadota bacterium]
MSTLILCGASASYGNQNQQKPPLDTKLFEELIKDNPNSISTEFPNDLKEKFEKDKDFEARMIQFMERETAKIRGETLKIAKQQNNIKMMANLRDVEDNLSNLWNKFPSNILNLEEEPINLYEVKFSQYIFLDQGRAVLPTPRKTKEGCILHKLMTDKIIIILCIIFLMGMCPKGTYLVTKVYDGDTISVKGYEKSIRILGIDTFESRYNYKVTKQARRTGKTRREIVRLGKVAKAKAKKILLDKCIILESDYKEEGKYGRLLRYVFVDNLDYQTFMIQEGLALPYCSDKKIEMYKHYNSLSKHKCK